MKNTSWLLLMGMLIAVPVGAQDAPLVGAVPAVFLPGQDRRTGEQINSQLVNQIATFPIASSSGGFTFEIDAAVGTVRPRSRSFGPTIPVGSEGHSTRSRPPMESSRHVRTR